MRNVEKKNYKNKIHKKHLLPWGQKNRTQEQPSYAYVTKKGNEEKEDTKPKQKLHKLINELKNLIEILKVITKETIKEHISTVPNEYVTRNQNQEKNLRKGKIQTKQKTLINELIPLSNRFSSMDIDPVETTTHIKTDSINLQKRLHKK